MKWTPENSKDKVLVDAMGKKIDCACTFDEETCEAELFIRNKDGQVAVVLDEERSEKEGVPLNKINLIKTRLPGCKVVDKPEDEDKTEGEHRQEKLLTAREVYEDDGKNDIFVSVNGFEMLRFTEGEIEGAGVSQDQARKFTSLMGGKIEEAFSGDLEDVLKKIQSFVAYLTLSAMEKSEDPLGAMEKALAPDGGKVVSEAEVKAAVSDVTRRCCERYNNRSSLLDMGKERTEAFEKLSDKMDEIRSAKDEGLNDEEDYESAKGLIKRGFDYGFEKGVELARSEASATMMGFEDVKKTLIRLENTLVGGGRE